MLIRVDLAVDCVARTASACSVRAAALCYEAWNHAVEQQSVVEAVFCQLLKVCYCIRRILIEQIDQHNAAVFECNFRLLSHM